METPADHNLFSNDPSVAGPSLTTINSNLVVPLSSLDKDDATSIPQMLDNRGYPEKSPCLIDGHDDDEHGNGSNEWGCGDVTAEYDGSKEDSHGLVRCSSAASITSNYIHSMGESSGSAPGHNMDHMGVAEVWSNEKHNAYLDSMEEDFVRDMYAAPNYCSLELCANQPHSQSESESESECESEASMVYTDTSSEIMDELEEEEEESSVVYSSTIIDEMMISEDAPQCMDGTISSSSSFCCLRRKGGNSKEKGLHATTTSPNTKTAWKRRMPPSFASSGPSNRKNIVQQCWLEIDIARLHEHAHTSTNPIQDSSPTIDSNVKKRACTVKSHREESSMKTLKLAGKKRPFLSSYCDKAVPSIGSHQDSQDM